MDRVRDGCLMKEMNRWRRLGRQEIEREMKEEETKYLSFCHAAALWTSECLCECECVYMFLLPLWDLW